MANLLNESWLEYCHFDPDYLKGCSDFQKKAIEALEYKILVSQEIIKRFPFIDNKVYIQRIETLQESIEIIKNLKSK